MPLDYERYISGLPLPDAAVKINGEYLEDLIPGYRTSKVEQRNSWSVDIREEDNDIMNGALYTGQRDQTREIELTYVITCTTREQLKKSMRMLKWILFRKESSEFVFADDPDVFVIGNISAIEGDESDAIGSGAYVASGTFTIQLSDPYQYSTKLYSIDLTPTSSDFTEEIIYKGYVATQPTLSITCNSTLGGIAFIDGEGHIVSIGDYSKASDALKSTFANGDKIILDFPHASITTNDKETPEKGDVANAWEAFKIQNGKNKIKVKYSSWALAPTITLSYREVFR